MTALPDERMISPVFREIFHRTEGPSPECNIGVGDVLKNTSRLTSTRATALSANRHRFLMRKRCSACADNLAEDSPATVAQAIMDYRADEPAHGYPCRTCRSGSVPHDATAQRWPAPQHRQPCVLLLPRLSSPTFEGTSMMFSTEMCRSSLANGRDRDTEEFFYYFSRGRTTGPSSSGNRWPWREDFRTNPLKTPSPSVSVSESCGDTSERPKVCDNSPDR